MVSIAHWWIGLNGDQQTKIVTTILDKGILALVVGIAAYVFSKSLERYKAYLIRINEFEKYSLPRVVSLVDDLEQLFLFGRTIREGLDKEYEKKWRTWLDALIEVRVSFAEGKNFRPDTATLSTTLNGGFTLHQVLVDVMTDPAAKNALMALPANYSDLFVTNLASLYAMSSSNPLWGTVLNNVRRGFIMQFFPKVTEERRTEFRAEADRVLQKGIPVLLAHRDQLPDGIAICHNNMISAVDKHPNLADEGDLFTSSYWTYISIILKASRPKG